MYGQVTLYFTTNFFETTALLKKSRKFKSFDEQCENCTSSIIIYIISSISSYTHWVPTPHRYPENHQSKNTSLHVYAYFATHKPTSLGQSSRHSSTSSSHRQRSGVGAYPRAIDLVALLQALNFLDFRSGSAD